MYLIYSGKVKHLRAALEISAKDCRATFRDGAALWRVQRTLMVAQQWSLAESRVSK